MRKINLNAIKSDSLAKSMILSMLCKPVSVVISLLYTPLLLSYLGDESYGIWSTILSIINWINLFDVGIGNGLRNILAKNVDDNKEEANKAVSTGYVIISLITSVVLLLGSVVIIFINDNYIFNTDIDVKPALYASFVCICINFVLSLSKVQLYAVHEAEKVGYMALVTQILNCIGVLVISLFSSENLLLVAMVVGLSGIAVNILFTHNLWKKHRYLIPSIGKFEGKNLKEICNLGILFFIVQISALVLYTTDNMIITALFGPKHVTPYHTVYAAFGIVNSVFIAFISPLWSKYTVVMKEGKYQWIRKSVYMLDLLLIPIAILLLIAVLIYEPFSVKWLGKKIEYPDGLILCVAAYYFLNIWSSIYTNVMNGIGSVKLQVVTGVTSAILNIPLSILLGDSLGLGTTGVILATVICMIIPVIVATIYVHRLLNIKIKLQK